MKAPPLLLHLHLQKSISKTLNCTKTLKTLTKIHSLIITLGLHSSPLFHGPLISKYSQFKNPNSSLSIFLLLHPPNSPPYTWNTLIRAMTHNHLPHKALSFYTKMKRMEIEPDGYTFPSLINACSALDDFRLGGAVHCHVLLMGFGSDLYIGNALVDMYSRMGGLEEARKVFDEMGVRDVVSWNSLISGYSANGWFREGLEVWGMSRVEGVRADGYTVLGVLPACAWAGEVEGRVVHGLVEKIGVGGYVDVCNGLLSVYFKVGRVEDCEKLFGEMGVRDGVSWNTMVTGYSQCGLYEESINVFTEMLGEN